MLLQENIHYTGLEILGDEIIIYNHLTQLKELWVEKESNADELILLDGKYYEFFGAS